MRERDRKINLTRPLLAAALAAGLTGASLLPAASVQAVTHKADKEWMVTFTENKKVKSNFVDDDFDKVFENMQPGDDALISIKVSNNNSRTVRWYMENEVISSLEESIEAAKAQGGGAYTYQLTWTGPGESQPTTLYDSDTVGGEESISKDREGLKEATNSLEDWLHLSRMKKGQSGVVNLRVLLDGETQGNAYQDTLADLQMNFAVELDDTSSTTNKSGNPGGGSNRIIAAQTGDMNMTPYVIVAAAAGIFLIVFAVRRLRRKEVNK